MTDRRPIQDHLRSIAPVGDAEDQARILGVDSDAVEAAGGTVAGTTGGDVVVGTPPVGTGQVQLVGSLLPAANQSNLHPLGMLAYAATYVEHLVMTNALFAEQGREVTAPRPSGSDAATGPRDHHSGFTKLLNQSRMNDG